jgi:hypothetical protein
VRTLILPPGLLLLASLSAAAAPSAPDTVTRWNAEGWTVWRVDRPTSDGARRAYPAITLHPGDEVRVGAGGCVRTERGWAPFADTARIDIARVTAGLVPMAEVAGRDLLVPAGADPADLGVALAARAAAGYGGARPRGGACAGQPDAFFTVAARSGAGFGFAPAPMDLVPSGPNDANSMWLNPRWGVQQTNPGSLADPKACFNLSGWFNNPACTAQRPGIDEPDGLTWLICYAGSTTPIEGHVNWYPATYTGPVFWSEQSWPDMDYNIDLVPPSKNTLTRYNTTTIHTEFDARETIDHFTSPWWKSFRGASDAGKRTMINGREAVIAGLVGTDCEHDCYSEIHPVWAIAIHVKSDPNDDVWAIFVRNFGNEGFCSKYQHLVGFPGNRFTFNFPWRAGATGVTTTTGTGFWANLSGMSYAWGSTAGQKVSLSVQLLSPYSYPRVHGELHLKWTGAALQGGEEPMVAEAPAELEAGEGEIGGKAERSLHELAHRLSAEQRQAMDAALAAEGGPRRPDAAPINGVALAQAEEATPLSELTPVTAVPDVATTRANMRRVLALRKAYGGALPGPVGAVIDRWMGQQK